MEKIWKNYWLYTISNNWIVKKWSKILNTYISNSWYVLILVNWKLQTLHRLVMLVFIWDSKLVVNHKNWIKTDNRLENLEYCTRSENIKHRFKILWHKWPHLWKFWKFNHKSIKIKQLDKDKKIIKVWDSIMDIYREYWFSHISEVCKWKRKTEWWFFWEYFNNNNKNANRN